MSETQHSKNHGTMTFYHRYGPPHEPGTLSTMLRQERGRRCWGTKSRGPRSAAYRAIKRDWRRSGRCAAGESLKSFAQDHRLGAEWLANKKRSRRKG